MTRQSPNYLNHTINVQPQKNDDTDKENNNRNSNNNK